MTSTELVNRREFAPIVIPSGQVLLNKVADDIDEARDFDVCSSDMAEIAQTIAGRLSTVRDELDAQRLATTLPLREGAKWVNDGYNPTIESLDALVASLKVKLIEWNRKVAKDKADAERAIAAQRQKEADAAALVVAEQKKAADKMLADAEAALKSGDATKADDLFTQASVTMDGARETEAAAQQAVVAPIRTTVAASGVKGASVVWKGRVVDKVALVKAAGGERQDALSLLDVNEGGLNAYARLHKGVMQLPGVEFYTEDTQRIGKKQV